MSLIEEIQAAALNREFPVSDLLRRVKLAAAKLKLGDTLDWVDSELNGYTCNEQEIPAYRVASGSLMATTFHYGTRPAHGDPQSIAMLSLSFFREPIGSLEALLGGTGHIIMPINLEIAKALQPHTNASYAVHFGKNVVVGITDAVRNLILDWAINLENEGILGEGVSFTMEEKKKAADAGANVQITNYGHIHQGDVTGHQNRTVIGGSDRSSNSLDETVFQQLTGVVTEQVPAAEQETLLALIGEMQAKKHTDGFREVYNKFLVSAANHMTILAPFIPALGAYIAG